MTTQKALPFGSAELQEKLNRQWRCTQNGGTQAAPTSITVLRLSILREADRALHTQKSHSLSVGQAQLISLLFPWETRLQQLRQANLENFQGSLLELLAPDSTFTPALRPEGFTLKLEQIVEKAKLERYDRLWEKALAMEAHEAGWSFWSLEASVEIQAIEAWGQKLHEALWPNAIVLFAESAGFEKCSTAHPSTPPRWKGQWLILLDSRFKNAESLGLDFMQWPGITSPPPCWRAL